MGLPTTLCGFLWARRAAADALGVEPEQTVSPSASLRRGQDAGEEGDEAAERLKLCCLARNHMLDATLHLLGLQAGPGAELDHERTPEGAACVLRRVASSRALVVLRL